MLFAQIADDELTAEQLELMREHLWWSWLFAWTPLVTLPLWGLLIWMLIYCARNDPERNMWIWIMIIVNPGFPLGGLIYFFARYLPSRPQLFKEFAWMRRFTRAGELRRLAAAARQIGNPHQFVLWGDALRETGDWRQAAAAYESALAKDPANLPALWGAALVELRAGRPGEARSRLERILEKDPGYKFGDVSLAYGRALVELRDVPAATAHLEKHLKRWKQPEAQYLLAALLVEQGQASAARSHLEALLLDLEGAPAFFVRQNRSWRSKARALLRRLPQ